MRVRTQANNASLSLERVGEYLTEAGVVAGFGSIFEHFRQVRETVLRSEMR